MKWYLICLKNTDIVIDSTIIEKECQDILLNYGIDYNGNQRLSYKEIEITDDQYNLIKDMDFQNSKDQNYNSGYDIGFLNGFETDEDDFKNED